MPTTTAISACMGCGRPSTAAFCDACAPPPPPRPSGGFPLNRDDLNPRESGEDAPRLSARVLRACRAPSRRR